MTDARTTSSPPSTVPALGAGPVVEWRLRMAAAERGVWTAAHLRRLLVERACLDLSPASVSVLFTKQPTQLKLTTLAAVCTALDCTPADLLTLRHPGTKTGSAPPDPAPAVIPPPDTPDRPVLEAAQPTGLHRRSLPPL
ncbi:MULTISPECIES: helix-turn-helix transcriptional regulator [unclassified Kitasatospora]|uniref:helix-turn-helix domain-containing protein n=1 Tax=unclassified Kitasatospora TaxID=2633591 RepID=UPI00341166A8